jgi:alkanesulfonate monooxygenase SsuD/methylene tetrahydromethanopterin reductase-like flavin-dependent oxidoreductase (luciferase family)
MAESVAAMRLLWAEEVAEFSGRHVDFGPTWSWPKPVQRPGPPVLIGGNSPGAESRVIEYGDGWLPQAGPFASAAEVRSRIDGLRSRAGGHVPVTLFGAPDNRDLLGQLADAGVDRSLLLVRSEVSDDVFARLDALAALV